MMIQDKIKAMVKSSPVGSGVDLNAVESIMSKDRRLERLINDAISSIVFGIAMDDSKIEEKQRIEGETIVTLPYLENGEWLEVEL